MKGIGILPGFNQSYIDHLVPLCHLLDFPLLVTDCWIKELIERYYPPLEVIQVEAPDYNLDPFLREYEVLVYVDYFRKGNGTFLFQDYVCSQKKRSIMSLHGNPDKYWEIFWLEQLMDEDIILVYGPQLAKVLAKKNIKKQHVISGNYKLEFYKKYAQFFDQTLPFEKKQKTILYAPTWTASGKKTEHRDFFSPFFKVCHSVFEALSDRFQLIVKVHPHLIKIMPDAWEEIKQAYSHIYFLENYPPIYPLLNAIDVYLGDYSSIGYDFLYFDRPLFFLETSATTALQRCGKRIFKENLSHLVDEHFERRELYHEVFGLSKSLKQLREEIEDACRSSAK
jgi:teichoic acid glycerol-phosphate primase